MPLTLRQLWTSQCAALIATPLLSVARADGLFSIAVAANRAFGNARHAP
jgi:hypothetical protein